MTTYLSGVQPSGLLHLGNYFGAMRRHIELQQAEGEHYYFIADYHALTTSRDPAQLRAWVREVAVAYFAVGLDPERAAFWRQSDVPEVLEIAWLLGCVAGVGLLERAHAYKDKLARGLRPSVGLFTYPVLMSADILAFDADRVPVGQDQVQHVEMAQDMAQSFNHIFSQEVFKRPEPSLPQDQRWAKIPGVDGQKMSKSYGNHIWIFESGKELKKSVARIVTDSRPPEEPKDPAELLPFRFLELFLSPAELADWEERCRQGGAGAPGYGHLKARIVEAIEEHFAPARARRAEFLADPAEVDRLLVRGAARAAERARAVRQRAFLACGLR